MEKNIAKSDDWEYSKDMQRRLVTFDWAIKNILRDKENFDILEGFLGELLGYTVVIVDLLESESNRETEEQKSNRVDVLAKDQNGTLILIEIQYEREYDYYQRMLFGASKLVTQYTNKGSGYEDIKKIISVHIIYFDLGKGEDYLYKGTTLFRGVHRNDELGLSEHQKKLFSAESISEIFPQHYIIRMEKYTDELKTPLDEWVYFLKTGTIEDSFKAKNIMQAKEKLDILHLNDIERSRYEKYLDNMSYERSVFASAKYDGFRDGLIEGRLEGRLEGKAEGKAEGRVEGRVEGKAEGRAEGKLFALRETARKMREMGADPDFIRQVTGLSEQDLPE